MVIHDLNIYWPGFRPDEANALLVVDADGVLPRAVALQQFKAIAGRGSEIAQRLRIVQLTQLALRNTLNIGPYPTGDVAMKQGLGVPIGERTNHWSHYARVAL